MSSNFRHPCVTLTGRRLSKAPLARVSLPVHLPRAPFILPHPSLSSLPRRAVPPPLLLGQPNGPWVPRDGVLAAQDHRQTVKNSGNFQVRFSRCPGLQNNAKMKLEKRRACMTFTFSCANAVFVCLQRERPISRMMIVRNARERTPQGYSKFILSFSNDKDNNTHWGGAVCNQTRGFGASRRRRRAERRKTQRGRTRGGRFIPRRRRPWERWSRREASRTSASSCKTCVQDFHPASSEKLATCARS